MEEFDYKNFLVENKLTVNSRLSTKTSLVEGWFDKIKQLFTGKKFDILSSPLDPKEVDTEKIESNQESLDKFKQTGLEGSNYLLVDPTNGGLYLGIRHQDLRLNPGYRKNEMYVWDFNDDNIQKLKAGIEAKRAGKALYTVKDQDSMRGGSMVSSTGDDYIDSYFPEPEMVVNKETF